MSEQTKLQRLLTKVRACTVCAAHLPFPPQPVLRASSTARLLIVGQAPGTKVQATGIPWNDPSGGQKPQRQIGHRNRLFARALMREHAGQQRAQPVPVQKTGEGKQPGAPGNFLVGEADLNGLIGRLEFNEAGHGLVSRFPCGN